MFFRAASDCFEDLHPSSGTMGADGKKLLLERMEKIQCCLQDIGSHVATVPSSEAKQRQIG